MECIIFKINLSILKQGFVKETTSFEGTAKKGRVEWSRCLSAGGGEHIIATLEVKFYLKYRPKRKGKHSCLQEILVIFLDLGQRQRCPCEKTQDKTEEKLPPEIFFNLIIFQTILLRYVGHVECCTYLIRITQWIWG